MREGMCTKNFVNRKSDIADRKLAVSYQLKALLPH